MEAASNDHTEPDLPRTARLEIARGAESLKLITNLRRDWLTRASLLFIFLGIFLQRRLRS